MALAESSGSPLKHEYWQKNMFAQRLTFCVKSLRALHRHHRYTFGRFVVGVKSLQLSVRSQWCISWNRLFLPLILPTASLVVMMSLKLCFILKKASPFFFHCNLCNSVTDTGKAALRVSENERIVRGLTQIASKNNHKRLLFYWNDIYLEWSEKRMWFLLK